LPNVAIEPRFLRRVSLEIARKWLHKLDFHVLDQKKGVKIDGYERDDVVEHCQKFQCKMVANDLLNKDIAPILEAEQCLPTDLECPEPHQLGRTVIIFHDESIFYC